MKRIGLISDTHGYLDPQVARHFDQCDESIPQGFQCNRPVGEQISQRAASQDCHQHPKIEMSCESLHHASVHVASIGGLHSISRK